MNKVNTKVDMRLSLRRAAWLDEEVAEALRRMVGPGPGGCAPAEVAAL